jgi:hypothetical protein
MVWQMSPAYTPVVQQSLSSRHTAQNGAQHTFAPPEPATHCTSLPCGLRQSLQPVWPLTEHGPVTGDAQTWPPVLHAPLVQSLPPPSPPASALGQGVPGGARQIPCAPHVPLQQSAFPSGQL